MNRRMFLVGAACLPMAAKAQDKGTVAQTIHIDSRADCAEIREMIRRQGIFTAQKMADLARRGGRRVPRADEIDRALERGPVDIWREMKG